jgi:uncharacterized protein (TIGR03118 family)
MTKFTRPNLLFLLLLSLPANAQMPYGGMPQAASSTSSANGGYVQVNLVSDLASNATHLDNRLVNAWGIVAGPRVVWVNDNGSGLATAYDPTGKPGTKAIAVPAPGGGSGTPSGLVFNNSDAFILAQGGKSEPSTFLIATEDGTVAAWNSAVTGSNAVIVIDNSGSGAVYKGLAIATNDGPQLYAADFHNAKIDKFDGQFHLVKSFTDTELPPSFAPFNVRVFRGRVFATFAKQALPEAHDDSAGPGNGFVDIFDTDGMLLRRLAANGVLNSPWGMAIAPANFGRFSHALLVGNFGNGWINAFDLLTGKSLGSLTDGNGNVIAINGLWGLTFEREEPFEHESEFAATRLYFTAGLNDEADGLFGFFKPISARAAHAR